MDDDFFLPIKNLKYHSDDESDEPVATGKNYSTGKLPKFPLVSGNETKESARYKPLRPAGKGHPLSTSAHQEDQPQSKKKGTTVNKKLNAVATIEKDERRKGTKESIRKHVEEKTSLQIKKIEPYLNVTGRKISVNKEGIFTCVKALIIRGKAFQINRLLMKFKILKSKNEQAQDEIKIRDIVQNIKILKTLDIDASCHKFASIIEDILEQDDYFLRLESGHIDWLDVLKCSKRNNPADNMCLELLDIKLMRVNLQNRLDNLIKIIETECDTKSLKQNFNINDDITIVQHGKNKNSLNVKENGNSGNNNRRTDFSLSSINDANNENPNVKNRDRKRFPEQVNRATKKQKVDSNNSWHHQNSNRGKTNDRFPRQWQRKSKTDMNDKDKNSRNNRGKDSDEFIKKKYQQLIRKNGNRLGQRGRRELWEKLYGREATHVKKGINIHKKRKPDNDHNHNKKQSEFKWNDINKSSQKGVRRNETVELSKLHPSWQAKRMQKEQKHIVEFTGTKITFD